MNWKRFVVVRVSFARHKNEVFVFEMSNENIRATSKDNTAYEELYKRMCTCERERDDFYNKLEAKEAEIKKVQQL